MSACPAAHPGLTARQLNRATLGRQLLLERAKLDVVAATERIGGLQAQEPASPHIGLWTRLAGFEPADLDRALARRSVVKGTLMRSTLHIVSAADYVHLWPAIVPSGAQARDPDDGGPLGWRDPGLQLGCKVGGQLVELTGTFRHLGSCDAAPGSDPSLCEAGGNIDGYFLHHVARVGAHDGPDRCHRRVRHEPGFR